jgi:hypothetical protein
MLFVLRTCGIDDKLYRKAFDASLKYTYAAGAGANRNLLNQAMV